jgi:malonate decarboxylase beta subunit
MEQAPAASAALSTSPYQAILARRSLIEMQARERARALLDAGSFHELLGPFDHLESPWLPLQGVVCQADDGAVIARGTLDGAPAVVLAIESAFQGGSIGEVSGAKIAAALELALRDCEAGRPVLPVILFETGGVRLQEANLGLAVIAEIQAAIVALRRHVPVVGVIAGMVGCFGGMSLAAALCSHLIMTRQGRLGMNGPEVIEQEAGIDELNASDRRLIWSMIGGAQRAATGLVDTLVEDDAAQIAAAVRAACASGKPARVRSEQVAHYLDLLAQVDPQHIDPEIMRTFWTRPGDGGSPAQRGNPLKGRETNQGADRSADQGTTRTHAETSSAFERTRGETWFAALAGNSATPAPVLSGDGELHGEAVHFIAVVPDPAQRFARARDNVVGLDQGWRLARAVRAVIEADAAAQVKRPIVALVDVKSQAYGRREELLGIHLACAAAVDAYASARLAGHPVIALIVGPAMSGAFLAHGYQANRILALDAPGTMVHAMGREAAARVTRRSLEALDALGETVIPMAYSMKAYKQLGLLSGLLEGIDADAPDADDLAQVRAALAAAIADARRAPRDLSVRLQSDAARKNRAASIEVRRRLALQWPA